LGCCLSLIRSDRVGEALDAVGRQPESIRNDQVSVVVLREIIAWDDAHEKSSDAIMTAHLLLEESPEKFLLGDDFRQLAWRYEKKGSFDSALEVVDRGVLVAEKNNEPTALLLIEKVRILQLLKRYDEAEKILMQLLEQDGRVSEKQKNQCRLLLARGYNARGSYVSALSILDLIAVDDQNPVAVLAAYERGWARMRLGAYEKALREFDFLLQHQKLVAALLDPKQVQNAMINTGECLFNLHRDQEAAASFREFIRLFPASPFVDRARYYLAWIDRRQGKNQSALDQLSAILKDYPETSLRDAVYFQRGQTYFAMGDFAAAISEFENLIDHYPESSYAGRSLLKIGESYFNARDFLRAKLVYLRAAQTYPATSVEEKARYGLLLLAYKQRQDDYLETEAAAFIKKFPRSAYLSPLVLMVADIYRRHRQWGELQSLMSMVISGEYPDEVKMDALYQMISLFREQKNEREVQRWCQKMVKQFPGGKYQCDCNLIFARQAFKRGEYGKVLDLLADSQGTCSDKHLQRQSLLLQAEAAEKMNRLGAAESFYKKVLSQEYQDSISYQALNALGALKERLHQYSQAEFFYQQAARNPKPGAAAAAQYKRSFVLQAAGKKQAAIQQYLRLPYLFPKQEAWIIKALSQAAELYELDNRTAAAEKIYRKLLQYHLSPQQREKVKKSLAALGKEG
jgi:tetratricopeptide (TPR) repeat protein